MSVSDFPAPADGADVAARLPPLTSRMKDLVDRIQRANRPPFHSMTPQEARAAYTAGAEVLDFKRQALARVEDFVISSVGAPSMSARLYAPSFERLPVLLFLHGGGFTIGNLETHDSLCRQFAFRSGAAVVAVNYRLAPEHRFPAAFDDCFAAMAWLAAYADGVLGLDGSRLAVAGDSAGGTLAAACALHAVRIGLPLALQILITPGTTAHQDTASHRLYRDGPILGASDIAWFFDLFIDKPDRDDWRFAPLNADDVDGVAPACLVLAEIDPLFDEGLAYGDMLRAAGVPVQLELFRGVAHEFIKMGRYLPEAELAQAAASAALAEAFGLPAPQKESR
jgi:acetyl esterase